MTHLIRHQKRISFLCLLFLLCLISSVSAAWVDLGFTGAWTLHTRTLWQTVVGQNDGAMTWQYLNVSDFAGYHAVWNFSTLINTPNWYDVQSQKNVKLEWNFSDVYVFASTECVHNWGSLLHNDWLYGGSAINESSFSCSWWDVLSAGEVRTHVNFQEFDSFEIFVSKVDGTRVNVRMYALRNLINVLLFNNTHDVAAAYWDYVDVTLQIWHEGAGYFLGHFSDTIYSGSYDPDLPSYGMTGDDNPLTNFFGNILNSVGKVLPAWLRSDIGLFSGYFVWAIPIIGIVMNVLATILPMLPIILVFYALDVGFTAISTGSFEPVGAMFTNLYALAAHLISAVVGIAGTIWDFIHFW